MAALNPSKPAIVKRTDAKAEAKTGEAAAALIAGGFGCLVIGLLTTLAEIKALEWFKNDILNINNPVGPLSGKTTYGVVAFFVAWGIAHWLLRDKEVDLKKSVIIAAVLAGLGFVGTFPPFFEMFAA